MAIFPNPSAIQNNLNLESQNIVETVKDRGSNFLFDFETGEFVIKDGKMVEVFNDAGVIFWIEKTIRTEYERARVYKNTDYGIELESYIGSTLPNDIIKLQLKDTIESALYKHERIKNISNFKYEKIYDEGIISFEVELKPLTFNENITNTSKDKFIRLSTLEQIQDFLNIRLLTNNKFLFKTNLGKQVYVKK